LTRRGRRVRLSGNEEAQNGNSGGNPLIGKNAICNEVSIMNVQSLARKASGWFVCIAMIAFSTAINAEDKNLAFGKPAIQSSSYCNYGCAPASRAVDGNTDGDFFKKSVTHTNIELHAFWRVDLEDTFAIGRIVIWNRTDMVPERLSNFRVSILDKSKSEVWGQDFYTDGGYPDPSLSVKVPNVSGQFVQVRLLGTNYLSLAEVQVFESTQ
jgi:hypothetical protein